MKKALFFTGLIFCIVGIAYAQTGVKKKKAAALRVWQGRHQ